MSLLRDVIARFSITVDDKPLSELDKKLKKARDTVNSVGKQVAAAWAGAAVAVYGLVDAASDANENLNVLQQTFKGNSDAVVAWSKTLGKELGRSEYTLQEAAGKFGAFLSPVFKDSGQDITAMSEDLSKLAVDLASFYNTSDEEAIMRLFSGMSGETEAVRRLGIDISDTSLDDLNKKNGDNRRLASLTLAEKSALRFQKIMMDTADKQGDAARTSDQWANSLKRAREEMKTLATTIGQRLMPYALRLLRWAEGYLPIIEDLLARSDALEAGFRLLATATAIVAAAFVALNFPMVLLAGVLATVTLAFEDLLVFLDGGHSVIGDFITIMTDVQDPLKLFNNVMDEIVGYADIFFGVLQDMVYWVSWVVDKLAVLGGVDMGTVGDGNATSRARARAGLREKNAQGVMEGQENARLAAAGAGDEDAFRQAYAGSTMTGDQLTQAWLKYRQQAIDRDFAAGVSDGNGLVKGGVGSHASDSMLNLRAPDWATMSNEDRSWMPGGQLGGASGAGVNVTVQVANAGATPEQIAAASKKGVTEALDERARKTAAAVGEEK
jgi:hypothetical protein